VRPLEGKHKEFSASRIRVSASREEFPQAAKGFRKPRRVSKSREGFPQAAKGCRKPQRVSASREGFPQAAKSFRKLRESFHQPAANVSKCKPPYSAGRWENRRNWSRIKGLQSITVYFNQHCISKSGSVGSLSFWDSRIRIHHQEKKVRKAVNSLVFVPFL
jgi:hypothetical protein